MDGDACGVWCGYCGRCTYGVTVERTCARCGDVFDQEVFDTEYVMHPWCEACHQESVETQARKADLAQRTKGAA